jgi:hypothetical protein
LQQLNHIVLILFQSLGRIWIIRVLHQNPGMYIMKQYEIPSEVCVLKDDFYLE